MFPNLLNNAAKYTEPGGRIWLTAERQRQRRGRAVKDTGIGIPAEKLPRIFEMFFQVDRIAGAVAGRPGHRPDAGAAAGGVHGGSVEARSDGPGKGSEFIVRLPVLVEEPQPRRCRSRATVTRSAVASRRILVVDDNQDSADSWRCCCD